MHEPFARRTNLLILAILAVLAATPYVQTLGHDFVDYDDNQFITENAIVRKGLTMEGVRWAFTSTTASNWHPLTMLSHMLDVQIWGMRPGGHHLTNIIIHVANTLLLFLVLRRLTGAAWRSALAAAIFAAHPLHVESVAWIAERKDVLSTFFGVLAIGAYAGYSAHRSIGRYGVVMGCFILSLLSKPMLVTLPCVLLLLDYWPLGRLSERAGAKVGHPSWSALVLEKVPLLMLSAALSVTTIVAQRASGAVYSMELLPLQQRLANAAISYAIYLAQMVWPMNLAVIYPLHTDWPAWSIGLALAALAAISAAAVGWRLKRPHLVVGWLWYLGTLVPVIGLVQVGVQSMADRYMYVPMIGLLIMLAWSLPGSARLGQTGVRVLAALMILLTGLLTGLAWRQTSYWKDTLTLFGHAISVTERNYIAHNILGGALRKRGQNEEARIHLAQALRLRPDHAAAHNNMGLLLMQTGDATGAEQEFAASLRLRPDDSATLINLGAALAKQGRHAEAIEHFRRAVAMTPANADGHVNHGHSLMALGRGNEAVASFRNALSLNANSSRAHAGLGAALWNLGKADEAVSHYLQALALEDSAETRVNLGVALAAQNKLAEAAAQFEHALRIDPNRADARRFLEMVRQQQ